MRAIVMGNMPVEMSSFGEQLGNMAGGTPVFQLNTLAERWQVSEGEPFFAHIIRALAAEPSWVIVGNAFEADPDSRLSQADIMYCFDAPAGPVMREYSLDVLDNLPSMLLVRSCARHIRQAHLADKFRELYMDFPIERQIALGGARRYQTRVRQFTHHEQARQYLLHFKDSV